MKFRTFAASVQPLSSGVTTIGGSARSLKRGKTDSTAFLNAVRNYSGKDLNWEGT